MMVTMLERASLRLFTASEMMAMELDMKPTTALKPTKIRLARMLIMLVLMTVDSRFLFMITISSIPQNNLRGGGGYFYNLNQVLRSVEP